MCNILITVKISVEFIGEKDGGRVFKTNV